MPKLLEGFSAKVGHYSDVRPHPERLVVKAVSPVPGTDYARDKIITFNFSSYLNELIRFLDEPLVVKGKLTWAVPVAGAGEKSEPFNPRDLTKEVAERHCYFLHPALGGATFVAQVDVQLDKQFVDNSTSGPYQAFYTALEKTFITRKAYMEKYGKDMFRYSRSDQTAMPASVQTTEDDIIKGVAGQTAADPTTDQAAIINRVNETVKYLKAKYPLVVPEKMMDLTESVVPCANDGNSVIFRVGFAGIFPFDCQSNILMGLTKDRYHNPYLPPGCNVCVNVHLREPIAQAMERYGVQGSEIYNFKSETALSQPTGKVKFEIEDMTLQYESLTLKDGTELGHLRDRVHNFRVDSTLLQQRFLNENRSKDRQSFRLNPNTLATVIMFTHQDFMQGLRGRTVTPRSTFFPGLKELTVHLSGNSGQHEILRLTDPGLKSGFNSQNIRNYHAELVRKGLYDGPFREWFPPETDVYGLEQALIVDLIPYAVKDNAELVVELEYKDTTATAKHCLLCFSLFQRDVKFNSGSAEWELAPVAAAA